MVSTLLLLAGLSLCAVIVAWQGVAAVAAALAHAGWGLVLLPLVYLVPMTAHALAWRALFTRRPPFATLLHARWIGESVNNLLPVARIGGEIARARLVVLRGWSAAAAGATVVVDLTLAVAAQMLFTLATVAMFVVHVGEHAIGEAVTTGVAVVMLLVGAFYLLQRRGMFAPLARRLAGTGALGETLMGGAEALDRDIAELYRRAGALAQAFGWRLSGWVLGTIETWLALYLLGAPVTVYEALMLEGLWAAARGAGFAIPGGLGVQEGGLVLFGGLLGLAGELALGLSFAKRARELALGLPGLVAWQVTEGWTLITRRATVVADGRPRV